MALRPNINQTIRNLTLLFTKVCIALLEESIGWELYWGNNKFTINFLKALCQLCMATDTGKFCLKPWKSIGFLPIMDEETLEIKNYPVRVLDKQDINAYGLSFSVKTRHMALFTSVAIEKAKIQTR